MSRLLPLLLLSAPFALAAHESPDESFYQTAAEGGIAEVEQGQLAQEKGTSAAVKEFGAMMVKDHGAANDKLRTMAANNAVELPTRSSMTQIASKKKLQLLSGEVFDKSYIKGMVSDHERDIKAFEKEAQTGRDPDAKAFALATLPTLRKHLQNSKSLAIAPSGQTD